MRTVDIADAKTHLGELVDDAAREPICITRGGIPIAQLIAGVPPRKPIDVDALRALTDSMPVQDESADSFIRKMRDAARY